MAFLRKNGVLRTAKMLSCIGKQSELLEESLAAYGNSQQLSKRYKLYSAHARTRKSAGSMTRKLSVTWSQ